MLERDKLIETALASTWHRQTAEASFDRWLQICEQEHWGELPREIDKMIAVFGASWYFTRFIYYRGRKSAELIDSPVISNFDQESILEFLSHILHEEEQEQRFEWLRSLKNQVMLCILIRRLCGEESIEENELALTRLAICTLTVAMQIVGLELNQTENRIAVLGMGRMAGDEMNFGSDLDLIFLYEDTSEDFRLFFSEKIRLLLRHMSLVTASGVLYDIDMRLRPHGTSGTLVTSINSFLEYHQAPRETWERQMMTRCSPIIDYQGLAQSSMGQIHELIYKDSYDSSLAREMLEVRSRVEDELGSRKGKVDVKRGRGGVMDIDFLTHYLQLKNAYKYPELQISSTRKTLKNLSIHGLITHEHATFLLDTYDFFKRIEACLRLFDMKSVNTFPEKMDNHHALVRAMAYTGDKAAQLFLEDFHKRRESVHTIFTNSLA